MSLLLKTFVDIILLRKGPDAVPASWIVFVVALALMLLSSFAVAAFVGVREGHNYYLALVAYVSGIAFYTAVVMLAGKAHRLLPSISSIIACGSLITLAFVAEFTLLSPLLGREAAGIIATLIIFWSVPVEGHIVARAIDQHWFIGIVIAMIAFIMQYGLQSAIGA